MPYIGQETRDVLDPIIKQLNNTLLYNGDLNYVLMKLAQNIDPVGYQSIRNFLGEIHEAEMEIRRRILVPYEDIKIEENGDVTPLTYETVIQDYKFPEIQPPTATANLNAFETLLGVRYEK